MELIEIQQENRALKNRAADIETDRAGLESLLKENLARNTENGLTTSKELNEVIDSIRRAEKTMKPHGEGDATKRRDDLTEMLVKQGAMIAQQEQVQRRLKNFPHTLSSTSLLPQPSQAHTVPKLHQQQPLKAIDTPRRGLGNRLSLMFGSGKNADKRQSIVANPEAERSTSRDPASSGPPSPTRSAYSNEDFK